MALQLQAGPLDVSSSNNRIASCPCQRRALWARHLRGELSRFSGLQPGRAAKIQCDVAQMASITASQSVIVSGVNSANAVERSWTASRLGVKALPISASAK